jgi:protease I
MSSSNLAGCRVAILATDGFEQSELIDPKRLLEQAGAQTDVVAPGRAQWIKAWNKTDWGDEVDVDVALEDAQAGDYDALVLPGGVMNPDKLRTQPAAITLVQAFAEADKPIAAICHGPWTLINAGLVRNRALTSWPSLRKDLENAGAHWQDAAVVRDGRLITSRNPGDIPAFTAALIELLGAKA